MLTSADNFPLFPHPEPDSGTLAGLPSAQGAAVVVASESDYALDRICFLTAVGLYRACLAKFGPAHPDTVRYAADACADAGRLIGFVPSPSYAAPGCSEVVFHVASADDVCVYADGYWCHRWDFPDAAHSGAHFRTISAFSPEYDAFFSSLWAA